MLKTGKQASRRVMHYALQSLLALFGEANALTANVNTNKCASTVTFNTCSRLLFSCRFHGASQAPQHGQFFLTGVSVVIPVRLPAPLSTPLPRLLPPPALLSTPGLPRQPLLRCHLCVQPKLRRLHPQFPVPPRARRKRHHQPALTPAGCGRTPRRRGPLQLTPRPAEGQSSQSQRRVCSGRRGRGVRGLLHHQQ